MQSQIRCHRGDGWRREVQQSSASFLPLVQKIILRQSHQLCYFLVAVCKTAASTAVFHDVTRRWVVRSLVWGQAIVEDLKKLKASIFHSLFNQKTIKQEVHGHCGSFRTVSHQNISEGRCFRIKTTFLNWKYQGIPNLCSFPQKMISK